MADDILNKSAEIVTNVIAATTKCSKHNQHKTVDHSAHIGHGSSHSLHDGMIVKFCLTSNAYFLIILPDDIPWWL